MHPLAKDMVGTIAICLAILFIEHLLLTGLTETCASVAMIPPTQRVGTVGSAGQLIPGIVARVVKPDGSLASEGEQGELVVTGPSMSLGYFNNEAAYDLLLSDSI